MLLMALEAFAAALVAHRYFRSPFGAGLMIYVSATIMALYAADLVGLLQPASWTIHALVIIGFVALVYDQAQIRFAGLRARLSPKFVVAAMVVVFCAVQLALYCSVKEYSAWDEFSHWGTVIRVIFEANTFHLNPNPLYFQDYPPGLALFAYHVMQLAGYTEPNAYFSYSILIFCFSASTFQLAYRISIGWFFVVVLLIWGIVQSGAGWASVLVDHMLSIYFAGIIGTYILLRQSKMPILALALPLGAFTLTKQAAASLALLAAGIVVADWLFDCARRYRETTNDRKAILAWGAVVAIALVGVTLFVPFTWQAYVAASGVVQGWGSYSPYSGVARLIDCCTTDREVMVATKFFGDFVGAIGVTPSADTLLATAFKALASVSLSDLTSGRVLRAPGFAMAATALASLLLLVPLRTVADRLRHLIFCVLLMVGAVGYTVSLLTAYLYAYSDYEAETLASFDRFLDVYTIGWALAVVSFAMREVRRSVSLHTHLSSAAAFLVLVAGFWANISVSLPMLSPTQVQAAGSARIEGRARIQQWAAAERGVIPNGAKVYILWPGTSGLDFWLVKYELLPHLTNLDCFGVIPALPKNLIQECVLSDVELAKTLAGYDYVVVGTGLDRLHVAYGNIFPDGPADKIALFKVDAFDGLHLTPVNE